MIIDFHTHVFPDSLAERAMSILTAEAKGLYTPSTNGTTADLLKSMADGNIDIIDISIVQPVITKQSQTRSLNEWSRSICSDKIIAFGGIYPHTDDYRRDIDYVADLGLKGLKFHAEYQDFVLDDSKMLKIYDYALSKDLILLHHAGFDIAFPPPFKSSPKQFAKIAEAMRGGVIIAAHFGGHLQWDDVEEYLAGADIYLDTSMGFEYFSAEQFIRIKEKHGTDKILFASDSPWSDAKSEIELLKALPISEQEQAAILGGNAKRILKL